MHRHLKSYLTEEPQNDNVDKTSVAQHSAFITLRFATARLLS